MWVVWGLLKGVGGQLEGKHAQSALHGFCTNRKSSALGSAAQFARLKEALKTGEPARVGRKKIVLNLPADATQSTSNSFLYALLVVALHRGGGGGGERASS